MNCLLVPTLALDLSLLDRLAASIDYPISQKLIIENGPPTGVTPKWLGDHPGWVCYNSVENWGGNLGVAGTWNKAVEFWPDEPAWLIVNDDEEFQPGCLKKICEAADAKAKDYDVLYVNDDESFDLFVWTQNAVKRFGTFDENFWPGYYEDWEMKVRFGLGNARRFYIGDKSFPQKHGKPPGGQSYHAMIDGCNEFNKDYFTRKWGMTGDRDKWGQAGERYARFKFPFNNPQIPITEWTLESDNRKARRRLWDKFLQQPNPSLYT